MFFTHFNYLLTHLYYILLLITFDHRPHRIIDNTVMVVVRKRKKTRVTGAQESLKLYLSVVRICLPIKYDEDHTDSIKLYIRTSSSKIFNQRPASNLRTSFTSALSPYY